MLSKKPNAHSLNAQRRRKSNLKRWMNVLGGFRSPKNFRIHMKTYLYSILPDEELKLRNAGRVIIGSHDSEQEGSQPTGWSYLKNLKMRAHNAIHVEEWETFWHLTVIREVDKKWKRRMFLCKCECGKERAFELHSLRLWVKSCWCVNYGCTKHGMVGTPMYKKWIYMRTRCSSKSPHKMRCYLSRWITVCDDGLWNQ